MTDEKHEVLDWIKDRAKIEGVTVEATATEIVVTSPGGTLRAAVVREKFDFQTFQSIIQTMKDEAFRRV